MSSLLAGLLSIGIIGVILNALSEIGLANVEGNCLNVLADIGGLAVAADTVELEGFRIASVLLCASAANFWADIALAGTPGVQFIRLDLTNVESLGESVRSAGRVLAQSDSRKGGDENSRRAHDEWKCTVCMICVGFVGCVN